MNPKIIVFSVIINYAFCDWVKPNCKSYSKIGCKCENSSSIICKNWDDMDKVSSYMNSVAKLNLMTFILKDVFLPALPGNLFQNTAFINIHFHNVSLPFLGPPVGEESPFSGLEDSLQEFHLKNVLYLYNWDWSFLSKLRNLIKFNVEKSKVLHINKDFSLVSKSLQHIEMVGCDIKWIDDGAFSSFISLRYLLLNRNSLSSFKRSYLPDPAEELFVIDLSENSLTELEEDLFIRMPILKIVSLEQNKLIAIPATIAEQMSIFNSFRINDNPLNCHCNLTKLCKNTYVENFNIEALTCTHHKLENPSKICDDSIKTLLNCR